MTVAVLPDIEAAVIGYLLSRTEVTDLVGTRIGSNLAPGRPAVRLNRWGGVPLHDRPLKFDRASIQLDVFAADKGAARLTIETVRAVLAEWPDDGGAPTITVARVTFGPLTWQPDTESTPAEPRYLTDCTITYS